MQTSSENIRKRLQTQIAAIEKRGEQPYSADQLSEMPRISENVAGETFEEACRAFSKIQRLTAIRERASEELRQRLKRDGFSEAATESALNRAMRSGLVDDSRFAEVFVRARLASGKGMRGIEVELKNLGINPEAALSDQEAMDEDDEVQRALGVLHRRPPTAKNQRDAAYRRLMQKGYGASVASTAARLWSERSSS